MQSIDHKRLCVRQKNIFKMQYGEYYNYNYSKFIKNSLKVKQGSNRFSEFIWYL